MTTDKRSVFTDALETLGMIIDETQKRDAIHLAVEPVVAKERLHPGDHINANGEKRRPYEKDAVGIVDPFLKAPNCLRDNGVMAGERFWLVLYPRTIKSLRHVWEHPAFPPSEVQIDENLEEIKEKVEKSKKWIEDYANEMQKHNGIIFKKDWGDICDGDYNFDYDDLMKAADSWVANNNYYLSFGTTDYKEFNEEFWSHYEIVRGIKLEENKKKNFFACAC